MTKSSGHGMDFHVPAETQGCKTFRNSKISVFGRAFTKNKHPPPLINLLSTPLQKKKISPGFSYTKSLLLDASPHLQGTLQEAYQEHCYCCLFYIDDAQILPSLSA